MASAQVVSSHTIFDEIYEDEVGVDIDSGDEPPSYEYIQANPPSYDGSLVARIRAAKHQARSAKEFIDSLCGILCAAAVTFIGMCIVIALPFVMVVVGSLNLDKCPAEPYIPVYLVAFGTVLIVTTTATVTYTVLAKRERAQAEAQRMSSKDQTAPPESNSINCLVCVIIILVAFLLTWQFAAYVWVFGVHEPNFTEPESPEYCFQPLYYFAFWLTIASFVIYATSLCVGCTLCCCVSVSR